MNDKSSEPLKATTSRVRWYWLDWLRVLAMGMIFLFHSSRPFFIVPWHVMNPVPNLARAPIIYTWRDSRGILMTGRFTRRKGAIMIVLTLLLFIFSGLFLTNTVMNPVESLSYQVGEVLCFIITPILLISGVVVCIVAPHKKKEKHVTIKVTASPPRKEPIVYSATRLRLLFASRIIGTVFTIFLLTAPFIAEGAEGWRLFLALFVAFPFPVFTMPYLVMALYLTFHKKTRWVDILPIIGCTVILLFLTSR